MEIEIAIAACILIVLLFLATVDMAFSRLSDVGLRRLASESDETGSPQATRFLREILDNRPRFRFGLSWTIQVLLISVAVIVTVALRFTESQSSHLFYSLLVGLILTVVFRQVLPALIVRNNPEKKLLRLLPLVRPLYLAASLMTRPLSGFFEPREQARTDQTLAPESNEERSDDNADHFQALMEVGEAEGIIEENEREMIESVVEFADTRVGEIMTPRTEICAIPAGSSILAARQLMVEEKYSRIPVYRESVDNIEGVIYVRDLMQAWAENKEHMRIDDYLRPPYFVPETKTAAELLKSMQVNHVQIAIVIDEYGGVAGIVTVEDIVEEIVGEIEDEDIEEEEIIEIIEGQDGHFEVIGSTEIDKIERLFNVELDDEEYNTVAGMVTSEAGYVPKIGEKLNVKGITVEILKADEKRIYLLRLRRSETEGSADALHPIISGIR